MNSSSSNFKKHIEKTGMFSYLSFNLYVILMLFLLSFSFPLLPTHSDFHYYTSELLLQLLSVFPCRLVMPPQAILQTSPQHMSPDCPLDLQWVSYCLCESVQTTIVCLQQVSRILLPPPSVTRLTHQESPPLLPASAHIVLHA